MSYLPDHFPDAHSQDDVLDPDDTSCRECGREYGHDDDCPIALERDYLRQAHDILSGKSMRLAEKAHLEALRDHFVGIVEETREALALALKALREEHDEDAASELLISTLLSLKAWAKEPVL